MTPAEQVALAEALAAQGRVNEALVRAHAASREALAEYRAGRLPRAETQDILARGAAIGRAVLATRN